MENDARKYCTRFGQLKAARAQYASHWAECYRFGAPERQQSFAGSDVKNQREWYKYCNGHGWFKL